MSDDTVYLHLYTGPSGWILPMLYPEDMAATCLMRMVGIGSPSTTDHTQLQSGKVELEIHPDSSEDMSVYRKLPIMSIETPLHTPDATSTSSPSSYLSSTPLAKKPVLVAGYASIKQALRSRSQGSIPHIDRHLTASQTAEADAYASLLHTSLDDLVLYEWFISEDNFEVYMRDKLTEKESWPMSWIHPMSKRKQVRRGLEDAVLASDESLEAAYTEASIALGHLSTRLGSHSEYFYGSVPCSLDALVFGYLAAIVYCPLEESRLRNLIASRTNLLQFCHNIREKYFADVEGIEVEATEAGPTPTSTPATKSSHKDRYIRTARTAAERAARESADKADKPKATASAESKLTEVERARRRRNQIFIAACLISFIGYALDFFEFEGLEIS